ncbi:hypothetical protein FIBSPDRAFT_884365 [Athelia psychrophila]|uniref:Uncharacterized protein n=1 Tax=Athelia psychrophila TaxID=1759441 RepID=A0A166T1F2_9AGAM|nr:hypothetical protein FIBSPDRAFT_884365 [Fibularhizoctonia sp. CBS 109695]
MSKHCMNNCENGLENLYYTGILSDAPVSSSTTSEACGTTAFTADLTGPTSPAVGPSEIRMETDEDGVEMNGDGLESTDQGEDTPAMNRRASAVMSSGAVLEATWLLTSAWGPGIVVIDKTQRNSWYLPATYKDMVSEVLFKVLVFGNDTDIRDKLGGKAQKVRCKQKLGVLKGRQKLPFRDLDGL